MNPLRFALIGTGFWSRFQLAAWREVEGARCVALCNRTRARAHALAAEAGGDWRIYDDPDEMLAREALDFIDIVTAVEFHRPLVELAARRRVAVICQKPMAPSLADAEAMVSACAKAGVPFYVHENWRWQAPLRAVATELAAGTIGRPFRARLEFCCSFPVFENQPFLAEAERFIIMDIGSHLLDVARFLFGEASSLFATTSRINPRIRGEDVATITTRHAECTVVTNLSYASRTEYERFPETFVFIEGSSGSLELAPGGWLRVTTGSGTTARQVIPTAYRWSDPAYLLVHSSIVDCHRNLLAGLCGGVAPETTGADNLKSMRLVFGAYQSASTGQAVRP